MEYSQDLVNRAHKTAKEIIARKALINETLSPQSLANILKREEIPEELGLIVAENLLDHLEPKEYNKAYKLLIIGALLTAAGLVVAGLYIYLADNGRVFLAGALFVPGLAYLLAGLWEYFDQV